MSQQANEFELVDDLEEVARNIEANAKAIAPGGRLADRRQYVKAFYTMNPEAISPSFGFSKYIGYKDPSVDWYREVYKDITGSDTEKRLARWFSVVEEGSDLYRELHEKLAAAIGRMPQKNVRICVVKPQFRKRNDASGADKHLLNLLVAVANTLPVGQRAELKTKIV